MLSPDAPLLAAIDEAAAKLRRLRTLAEDEHKTEAWHALANLREQLTEVELELARPS